MFIRLNSVKLFANHGVYEEEIQNGNHFEIDVEVEVPDSLGAKSDDLTDALDYSKLYKSVIEVSEKRRYNLLEAFCCDICMKIFDDFAAGLLHRRVCLPRAQSPIE